MHTSREIILYHPDLTLPTPQDAGVPMMHVVAFATEDNVILTSWFAPAADPQKPLLLFFMGDTGALSDRAGEFIPYLQNGYGMLLLGYRGFNGNGGIPSEQGLYRDARAAVAWLNAHDYPLNRIVFYGHSLGTGIAVEMALEYPKALSVILEAPYTTLPDTVQLSTPGLQANWFMADKYNNIAKVAKITIPLLIIQGTGDEVIPVAQGKALYEAAKGPKQAHFIPDAGHMNLYAFNEANLVMDFLDHPPQHD